MDYNLLPESIHLDGDQESREAYVDGKRLSPEHSLKLRNHSPDGFNWGYGGSGPAQLSLVLLLRFMPEAEALQRYQRFKFKVIAGLPRKDFHELINLREIIQQLDSE